MSGNKQSSSLPQLTSSLSLRRRDECHTLLNAYAQLQNEKVFARTYDQFFENECTKKKTSEKCCRSHGSSAPARCVSGPGSRPAVEETPSALRRVLVCPIPRTREQEWRKEACEESFNARPRLPVTFFFQDKAAVTRVFDVL